MTIEVKRGKTKAVDLREERIQKALAKVRSMCRYAADGCQDAEPADYEELELMLRKI